MSSGLKNESGYTENEFNVLIEEDSNEECKYRATVSGYNDEDEKFSEQRDVSNVLDNLLWKNWYILNKEKL
ncbi:hypothetical protein [Clostridium senegalense]|uniref:Uncharacterized protein n=1 Tax=Clostridium senegalense TaxID=1465809 RepID=A0A6M0H472_9CLOT|nr:hypothetical protein [Clostridium senegalense]NEU05024.1 hypothetical protein [Clostridium senegalense]